MFFYLKLQNLLMTLRDYLLYNAIKLKQCLLQQYIKANQLENGQKIRRYILLKGLCKWVIIMVMSINTNQGNTD